MYFLMNDILQLVLYPALEILVLYALFAMDICITECIFRDPVENEILLTH